MEITLNIDVGDGWKVTSAILDTPWGSPIALLAFVRDGEAGTKCARIDLGKRILIDAPPTEIAPPAVTEILRQIHVPYRFRHERGGPHTAITGPWRIEGEGLDEGVLFKDRTLAAVFTKMLNIAYEAAERQRDRYSKIIARLQDAAWERVVSISGNPAKTFYQCRVCHGVDPERNPQDFTNVGHAKGCPFAETTE